MELPRRGLFEAAGALVLGLALPGCAPRVSPVAAHGLRTGELAPNAWLRIGPDDRITFYLDRVEMGQGTMTSHVTLIAEELEVDPRRIHVEHAVANRAYDNPTPYMPFQITGGSTSTASSWEPLRRAGASAREMLRQAAAARWGVAVGECAASDGAVTHAASGKKASYGELAREASQLPVPTSVALKPPSAFRWIGKPLDRVDARAKVDGSAVYGLDVKLDGLLTAVVLRSPVPGGRLRSFDATQARQMPGIIDIFEVPSGVAVVAERSYRARSAAAKVTTAWDEGALGSLDSQALEASYVERARHPAKVVREQGDLGKLRATRRVQASYTVPFVAHATMEPMNCTAHVTRTRCEVWAPTQGPGLARELLQKELGLPYEAITIHTTFLGGGFGRRLEQDFVIEAAHVSRRLGRPVKVIWSREEDLANDFYRPAAHGVLEGVLDEQGSLVGWFHRIVSQSIVAQASKSWVKAILPDAMPLALKAMMGRTAAALYLGNAIHDATSSEGAADFAYAIPNLRVEYAQVDPGVPVGFWRSVGNSENVFVVECFLDEMAQAAGRDPYEFRRALLARSPRQLAVLDLAAQRAGWGTPPPAGVFRGIAQASCFGSHCAQVAEVSMINGAPRVQRVVAAIDCGRVVNPDIVRAQIEGSIVFGLSAALKQRITFAKGRVQQTNFHQFGALRMHESPRVEVHIVPSEAPPSGVGEPGLPPVAPAVANAIFAATGRRLRAMPLGAG